MIEFRTLGGVELKGSDGSSFDAVLAKPKRVALLAYLALGPSRGFQRRDTLLGMFWPELDQERARHTLRQTLYDLRRAVGDGVLVNRGDEEVGVDPERLWCDASAFDAAVASDDPERALDLYRGPFLPGFHLPDAREFEKWMDNERTRLLTKAGDVAWQLAEARKRDGDAAEATQWARRAASLSPTSEVVIRRLINFFETIGDRPAALRVYRDFEKYLSTHYELRPSPETLALLESIREGRRSD